MPRRGHQIFAAADQLSGIQCHDYSDLALGIDGTYAMFAIVDHVLLRLLPYCGSQELVEIKESVRRGLAMFGAPTKAQLPKV